MPLSGSKKSWQDLKISIFLYFVLALLWICIYKKFLKIKTFCQNFLKSGNFLRSGISAPGAFEVDHTHLHRLDSLLQNWIKEEITGVLTSFQLQYRSQPKSKPALRHCCDLFMWQHPFSLITAVTPYQAPLCLMYYLIQCVQNIQITYSSLFHTI